MPFPSPSCGPHARLAAGLLCGVLSAWPAAASSAEGLAEVERALTRGDDLQASGDARCVDWYFAAARDAWQAARHVSPDDPSAREACKLYHAGLAGVVHAGQAFGRLDARTGLVVRSGGGATTVPVVHYGFPWSPADFHRLREPPRHLPPLLSARHTWAGVGLPLVVLRWRDPHSALECRFFTERTTFAATAVLRFSDACDERDASAPPAVLEFYDPLRIRHVMSEGQSLPLAADVTAPLAYVLESTPRTYLAGFVQPGGESPESKLQFAEPVQPGKVPVVLIHGLLSDPQSFADLANDLRAMPGFADRFQLWTFRYPTGQSFLRSAAALRGELQAAIDAFDPAGVDPGLQNMVLVGHSMGGLLAKLQVTHSDETIWYRLANRPLEAIVTTEATRARLAEQTYFDPLPFVRRVVFLATPHAGTTRSSRALSGIASRFLETSPDEEAEHVQLILDNPGVFADFVEDRQPTSVDLFASDSPLLAALRELQVGCGVELHTVLGVSHPLSLDGSPSDGVVPVPSARHPGSQSELAVAAKHVQVHRHPATSAEVWRILQAHLHSLDAAPDGAIRPPSPSSSPDW